MTRPRASLVVPLVLAATAACAAPATPLPPAEQESLAAFAAADAGCLEWSDGCVVCRRQDKDAFACSTPGIACTPSPLACRNPAPSKDAMPAETKP